MALVVRRIVGRIYMAKLERGTGRKPPFVLAHLVLGATVYYMATPYQFVQLRVGAPKQDALPVGALAYVRQEVAQQIIAFPAAPSAAEEQLVNRITCIYRYCLWSKLRAPSHSLSSCHAR